MTTNQVKIGHYILGKTIGTGGFARVKSIYIHNLVARHDLTNIEVAVKIINKKNMKNKNMISKVIFILIIGQALNSYFEVHQSSQYYQII